MWVNKNPILSQTNAFHFHIVGQDECNPWQAQPYKLTPKDIANLSLDGASIIATPHVGLHPTSNNMYPHMGVVICDFAGNQCGRDYRGYPEFISQGGRKVFVAKQTESVLSPYLQLDVDKFLEGSFESLSRYSQRINLAHVQHQAKKDAIGEKNVILDSELLKYNFVSTFYEVIMKNENYILAENQKHRKIFNRYCDYNGRILDSVQVDTQPVDSFLKLKNAHELMITEDTIVSAEGYLPIKEVMIVLIAIVSYWKQLQLLKSHREIRFEIGDVFTVTGRDMMNYLKGDSIRTTVNRIYTTLLESGNFSWLPNHLRFILIPGGQLSFLPCNAEIDLTKSAVRLIEMHQLLREHDSKMTSINDCEKSEAIKRIRPLQNDFLQEKKYFQELLITRRGFTQYDLLNGDGVDPQIINGLMNISFEVMKKIFG
jgi:hypothetical protein